MGVDITNVLWSQTGVAQGIGHGLDLPLRVGVGNVFTVAVGGVTTEVKASLVLPLLCMGFGFQNQSPCALAHRKTMTVLGKGSAGLMGIVAVLVNR